MDNDDREDELERQRAQLAAKEEEVKQRELNEQKAADRAAIARAKSGQVRSAIESASIMPMQTPRARTVGQLLR